MPEDYRYPFIDSTVFIAIVMAEIITVIKNGVKHDIDRRAIGIHVIEKIERKLFKGAVSPYTYAECYKRRQGSRLAPDSQDLVLEYLNNDECFDLIEVDRTIGIKANSLCRTYGIMPTDAIHVACALSAGCDKFLTWDEKLAKAKIPGLSIEAPRIIGQTGFGI